MIRFYSENLVWSSSFNMCRDKSNQPNITILDACDNQIQYFQEDIDRSIDGIIVNENIDIGCKNRKKAIATTNALIKIQKSGKKIGIWHSARLSNKLAKKYQDKNIDYIFIESYWPWKSNFMLWLFFKQNWKTAKRNGILDKTIFVLGYDYPRLNLNDLWSSILWCNDEKTLEAQTKYIHDKCQGIAGIGMYVLSVIPKSFFDKVSDTFNKYFPGLRDFY